MRTCPDTRRHFIRVAFGAAFTLSQFLTGSAALAQASAHGASAPDYQFAFMTDEAQDSRAVDINNQGAVVGTIVAPGQYWGQETLWPPHATPVSLQGFGGQVTAVNNAGRAAGFQQTPGQDVPVTWWQGQLQQLPLDGNFSGYALGISDTGTVVGSLVKPDYAFVPAQWTNGQLQPLPIPQGATGRALDINGWGQIVGELRLNVLGSNHAYLWTRHIGLDLHPAGYASSTAWAINSIGMAAGWASRGSHEHAGVWLGRHFVDLNGRASRSLAYDINNAGQVVGEANLTSDSGDTAVLWDLSRANKLIDLTVYLPPALAQDGWRLLWAKAINDAGEIVGDAYHPDTGRTRAFRLTPVRVK